MDHLIKRLKAPITSKRGADCPICSKEKSTAFIAMLPVLMADDTVKLPHEYAVCAACYAEQREHFYAHKTKVLEITKAWMPSKKGPG